MSKASREKIGVPFHPLTAEEVRQWYRDKLLTTAGYLLAIKKVTKLPGTNLVITNVLKFCEEWEISKSAFYRAVNELRQKGYIDWEVTHGIILQESKKVIPLREKKCPTSGTDSHERDTDSHERDTDSHERDTDSHERDTDSHERENQSLKPSPNLDSSTPQIYQIYSEFIQTLSEGERENFEKFVRDSWKKITAKNGEPGKEIISLERFLNKPSDLKNWWQKFLNSPSGRQAKKKAATGQDWHNDPRFNEWIWAAFERGYEWVHENEAEREVRQAFYDWAFAVNAFEGVCV